MKKVFPYLLMFLALGNLNACKESGPQIDNPYETQKVLPSHFIVTPDNDTIDPTTIQGLHKLVFSPTCANSGCHDGNFEPDFRTIESSYNTLVNQPVIKNDEMNPLTSRVIPWNADASMLIRRLTIDLNGNSGIMPLVTEPGSDWHGNKEAYIGYIKTWINNGALNQRGDSSSASNFPVQLVGVAAKVNGQLLTRAGNFEPILVPEGTGNVEIWFAFQDDALSNDQLTNATLNLSKEANNFDSLQRISLQYVSSPLVTKGYLGKDENFHFKAVVSASTYIKNDVLWLRSTISDGVNFSELPNKNSLFRAKKYATFRIQ